jgi:DNA-binding transcriptional MocR family regulator
MEDKKRSINQKLKYVKLYDWITSRIYNHEVKFGEKLPSETMMCNKFEVSRQTVRTTMEFLEQDETISYFLVYRRDMKPVQRVKMSHSVNVTVQRHCGSAGNLFDFVAEYGICEALLPADSIIPTLPLQL